MTAHYVGPVKGKKETATKMEVRRNLVERKTIIGSDGRKYGQNYNELCLRAYGKIPKTYEGKHYGNI